MMGRAVLIAALLSAALGAVPTGAAAQRVNPILRSPTAPLATRLGVLVGSITDSTRAPIAEAEVSILSAHVRVRSNADGRFRIIDVPLGQYLLVARRDGFRPLAAVVELGRADTLQLHYMMERALATTGALAGGPQFGPPLETGERFLVARDEIDRRALATSAEYLALAPDVSLVLVPNALGLSDLVAVSAGRSGAAPGDPPNGCALPVVIDDVVMPARMPLALLPEPRNVERIEVFAATASACGKIVIRTDAGGL